MGHNTLGVLPRTKKWTDVVALLGSGVAPVTVIAASAEAAQRDLLRATDDPVYVETVRLLLVLPLAARSEDFGQALRDADVPAPDRPEVLDLLMSVSERLDEVRRATGARSDLGELASRALTRTISREVGGRLPGLFAATPEDVQTVLRKLSWSQGIATFTRGFFGDLVGESLSYWLDRTLANHIGAGLRFANATDRSAFDVHLDHFSAETTRIIQEFSGGWYGKTLHERGGFGPREAAVFGSVALRKIVDELRARHGSDG